MSRGRKIALALATVALGSGCIKSYATGTLADTLAADSDVYARDDDPKLIEAAVPFGLKTMESVLEAQPRHRKLLTALAKGFTSFADAFVDEDADELEARDVAAARVGHVRARRLYLRARDYGLRGLDVAHEGLMKALLAGKTDGLARATKDDVPLLFWTGASWALAIHDGKDEMKLVGQLPVVEAIMDRALALDESFDEGAIHEFFVSYDGGRAENEGGGEKKARAHLERALALSKNKKLGVLVSFAEAVDVPAQNKTEFKALLDKVLAFDADSDPPHRLANLVAQRRARWLLTQTDELFAE